MSSAVKILVVGISKSTHDTIQIIEKINEVVIKNNLFILFVVFMVIKK